MFLVDTNILIYAADSDSAEHGKCSAQVEEWRREPLPWYTTWGILYEFLRVSTHPRVMRAPWDVDRAWGFVEGLLASPSLRVLGETSQHRAVAAQSMKEVVGLRGNLLHDAHTAFLMREHGIRRIFTRDTDFH